MLGKRNIILLDLFSGASSCVWFGDGNFHQIQSLKKLRTEAEFQQHKKGFERARKWSAGLLTPRKVQYLSSLKRIHGALC